MRSIFNNIDQLSTTSAIEGKWKETASINCSNFRGEQNCVELVPRAGFSNTKSRDEFDLLGART